ncbi:hypothetical protein L4D15_06205 [Enterovibrio norvegicus]|uniref:hypothetical protein n=1 Tax=Enterovibrio norvegicus TaxID=188144 RepID=UPI003D134C2F
MLKRYLIIPSVLFSLSLIGCGGSSDTSSTEPVVSEYLAQGFDPSQVTSWFDVEVSIAEKTKDSIGFSRLTIEFDINNNSTFDEGDIRLIAGNNLDGLSVDYQSNWFDGADFYVEYIEAGTIYRMTELRGIVIGGGTTIIRVGKIGGVWLYTKDVDSTLTESIIGLRVNKGVVLDDWSSAYSSQMQNILTQIQNISSSTPVNVELKDGNDPLSVDYAPSQGVFSQQSNGVVLDSASDYFGTESWVDILSVSFKHEEN